MALFCALALIAAGVALVWAAANGHLTRPVTSWISAQLGRRIEADGGLLIEFGHVTRISATGLRLANISWGAAPEMLQARYVLVDLDTRSLFQNTVVVRHLVVRGLDLRMERNSAGQGNWSFDALHRDTSPGLPVMVETASVSEARLHFVGPRMERPLHVDLDSAMQSERADGTLDLTVHGVANATPLALHMSAGPFARLMAGRKFILQAEGHLGEMALDMSAAVDSLMALTHTEAHLSLRAPDAAYLTTRLGLRSLGDGPVTLEVTISRATDAGTMRGSVSGQIGEFAVNATGAIIERTGADDVAVEAQVSGPDLSRVGSIVGVRGLPAEPFRTELAIGRSGATIRIQKAEFDLADGRITVSGVLGPKGGLVGSELSFSAVTPDVRMIEQRLGIAKVLSGPFAVTGSLHHARPGDTELHIHGTTTVGKFSLGGPIGPSPDFYGTQLEVTVEGSSFAPLGLAVNISPTPTGAYKGNGNVTWTRTGLKLRGANLAVGDEILTLEGNLGRPIFARGTDLRFALRGDNAARLAQRFGLLGFPTKGYRVSGRIQRKRDYSVLSNIRVAVGASVMELDGTLGDPPDLPSTNLAFTVNGASLEEFSGVAPGLTWPRANFRAAGQAVVTGRTLHFRNVQATVDDAQGTVTAEFALPLDSAALLFDLDARVPDLAKLLPGLSSAAAAGKDLHISAVGSRLNDTWSTQRLRLESAGNLVNFQGLLQIFPHLTAKDVQLDVRSTSLLTLGLRSGHRWPDQPLELRAKVSGTEKDVWLNELMGRIGASDFTGSIAAHNLADTPAFDVGLDFKELDLNPYVTGGRAALTPPALVPPPKSERTNAFVIPLEKLHLPRFNGYTGKFAIRAQRLQLRDQVYNNMRVQATIGRGRFSLDPLEITGAGGQISARIDLTEKGNGVAAQLSGTGKNLRLSPLLVGVGGPNATVYSAQINVQGSGANLRELAGSLNGRIRLVGVGGRVANSGWMSTSSDFAKRLLTSLNPLATRQPTTEVVCVAYLLRAKDGILTTDPALVVRTAEIDIVSSGSADLRTEHIDFNFKTAARKGLGLGVAQLINPYIKVTGTLGKPSVALDPTGTLVNGGAAFATAGLSIVATTVWDRVVHEKDACAVAVAESDRRSPN